jgi:peptidoglycan/LPS O-acetylase OafA/YrhL
MIETSRIIGLDYLRGTAAVAVVLFHLGFKGPSEGWMIGGEFGWFSTVTGYGYLGVNLFFLISGFVIAMSAENAAWLIFLRARFIRLMPAMWICASVTAIGILGLAALTATQETQSTFVTRALAKNTWGNYFASLTLAPSWFGFTGIDSAYWSLRIEVQFYLAVGLLLLFNKRNWTSGILFLWLLASTINLIRPVWRIDFIFCLTWAPYFIVGIILHSWRAHGASFLKQIGLGWSCILCLGYAYKSAVKDGYESPLVTCTLVITIIILFAYTVLKPERTTTFSDKQFSKLGLMFGAISYPLYLVHQELGYAFFNTIVSKLGLSSSFSVVATLALTLIVISTLSWAIHKWPEPTITSSLRKYLPSPRLKSNQ